MSSVKYRPRILQGFSLIEFMVAILLGAIVIGGAVSVYVNTKRSYTEVEQFAALSENGRFALQMITYSLRHAGFFGAAKGGDVIAGTGLAAVTNDCTAGSGAAVFDTVNNFIAQRSGGNAFGCINDAAPGSDVLVIKRALPSPRYDANPNDPNEAGDGVISFIESGGAVFEPNEVYLISNSEAGMLMDGDDSPKPGVAIGDSLALGVAWPYVYEAYYIQNLQVPTLSRRVLVRSGGNWALTTEQLVQGVEAMNFRFGLDNDSDGEIDIYTNTAGVGTSWEQVVAVEVFLLMRNADPDPNHTDFKTYQLADRTVTPNDNIHRVLLTGSVNLRNPGLTLRGGS